MKFIGFYDYTVILTYMSLASAFLGMCFAHQGSFTAAVLCLMLSGFCADKVTVELIALLSGGATLLNMTINAVRAHRPLHGVGLPL